MVNGTGVLDANAATLRGNKRNTSHPRAGRSKHRTRERSKCRRASTKYSSTCKSWGGATTRVATYVVTHYTGKLLASVEKVAEELDAKSTPAHQRAQALAFYNFLEDPQNDLRDLNGDDSI